MLSHGLEVRSLLLANVAHVLGVAGLASKAVFLALGPPGRVDGGGLGLGRDLLGGVLLRLALGHPQRCRRLLTRLALQPATSALHAIRLLRLKPTGFSA